MDKSKVNWWNCHIVSVHKHIILHPTLNCAEEDAIIFHAIIFIKPIWFESLISLFIFLILAIVLKNYWFVTAQPQLEHIFGFLEFEIKSVRVLFHSLSRSYIFKESFQPALFAINCTTSNAMKKTGKNRGFDSFPL